MWTNENDCPYCGSGAGAGHKGYCPEGTVTTETDRRYVAPRAGRPILSVAVGGLLLLSALLLIVVGLR